MNQQLDHDSALTVFVGRGCLSHGIRQTLEDFTATGLTRDLAWVDTDTFSSSSSEITYLCLGEDGTPQITREPFNALVARLNVSGLHLGVINVVGVSDGTISSDELQELLEAIDSVLTGPRIERTNLIISAVEAPLEGDLPTLRGYTNLFLAPEDSPGPESATVPFHFDALDNRFTLHCVAGIASLFGLWEGSRSAPVARLEPGSGGSFRLVRAYYRRIDGQEVQARLKARIFDTTRNPLPRLNRPGQSPQYTEDPVAFAQNAAEDLLTEFNRRLEGHRSEVLADKTRYTTSSSAAGEFLRAWGRGMVSTPARFFRELSGETRSFVDDTVQSTLYGEGSRTHVGGYRETTDGELMEQTKRAPRPETLRLEATRELGWMWTAYANTAMSLLDASPRHITDSSEASYPGVVREHAEGEVRVARSSADVIPGPDASFGRDLPVEVKSTVGGGDIAPYDLLGVADYERRLSDQRHGGQRDVGRVIGDFKQWQEENSESFAYFVGRGLVERKTRLEKQRDALDRQIAELENHHAEVEETGAAAGAARWFGWVFMSSLVVFTGLWGWANLRTTLLDEPLWGWAANLNAASASAKGWMFGVWAGLWILCWVLQVVFETRDEIRFRHRRRDVVGELEAARANLREVDRALLRLGVGYRQFLSTSRMIGALLAEPFGRIRHLRVDSTIPVNTMPDSVVFAEATPGSGAVDALADRFRRDLYREGWLDDYVMGGLKEALTLSDAHHRIAVNEVFSTSGSGTEGALARLATTVTGESFRARDRAKEKWRAITEELRDNSRHNDADILSPLQIYRAGKRETASPRLQLDEVRTVGAFNGEIATEKGRVDGVLDLDPRYCTYHRNSNTFDAIGVSEVLVQVGGPAFQGDVAFRRPERPALSADILRAMPVSEDFQSPERPAMLTQQTRPELPGTGEF